MDIMNTILSSVTTVELMILFQKNPNLVDTLDGIAKKVGLTNSQIESDIAKLVELGVLKKMPSGTSSIFLLDRAKAEKIDLQLEEMFLRQGRIGHEWK